MESLDKKDPFLMLSVINTKLRDECHSLEDLCKTYAIEMNYVKDKMAGIGYTYNQTTNQFV